MRSFCSHSRPVVLFLSCQCTPVCRLCGRYLALLGRPIRVTVPAVTVASMALVGSLIRSSNLPHSLQRGVHVMPMSCLCLSSGSRSGLPAAPGIMETSQREDVQNTHSLSSTISTTSLNLMYVYTYMHPRQLLWYRLRSNLFYSLANVT